MQCLNTQILISIDEIKLENDTRGTHNVPLSTSCVAQWQWQVAVASAL
jgi:hypothetical protein